MAVSTEAEYRAKKGRQISDSVAELVGPEIQALSQQAGQEVTPAEYENWTRNHPDSESYALFARRGDWDDTEAAQKWRLHQARNIINSIEIKIIDNRGDEQYVPAFPNVIIQTEDEVEKQAYVSFDRAVHDEKISQTIVAQAKKEFMSWRRRYLIYRNELPLSAIYEATDELVVEDTEST